MTNNNGHTRKEDRPNSERLPDKYWCPRYEEWLSFEEFIYRRHLEKAEEQEPSK